MTYRLTHDPESGAFYVHVRDGEYHETVPLAEPGFGAGADVDEEGKVLGFEFLSFEEYAELVARSGGSLDVPDRMGREPAGDTGPDPEVLREAISSLEQRERQLLRLLIWEGLNIAEATDRLGLSLGKTMRLRSSAFANLNDALRGSEGAPEGGRSIEDVLSTLRP